jgi:hypothetical protein
VKVGARGRGNGCLQDLPRLRIAALFAQQGGQARRGVMVSGLNIHGTAKTGLRRFFLALCRLRHAQIRKSVGVAGADVQCPPKTRNRQRIAIA